MPDRRGGGAARRYEIDERDRSSSQEWAEEGSQQSQQDDARSWCSQKSENAAQHMMNGETRFPTAMSYASDAQRSDVATVCSGSVVEDIEVESVMSQEDEKLLTAASLSSSQKGVDQPPSERIYIGGHRYKGSGTRVVEFAEHPLQHHEAPTIPKGKGPPVHTTFASISTQASMPSSLRPETPTHDMGPPLNRALLLQRGGEGSYSQPGSDNDCGGSLDIETRSTHSQEDTTRLSAHRKDDNTTDDAKQPAQDALSQSGSVKSYGSLTGVDKAAQSDTDDCGGSLDVETHSTGTRSIHSQDEAPPVVEMNESSESNKDNHDDEAQIEAATCLLTNTPIENGRRSPGGTIYKGRGVRRYQGRYMHLPLKRFHHNGVNLDSVADSASIEVTLKNGEHSHKNGVGNYAKNGFSSMNALENGRDHRHRQSDSNDWKDHQGDTRYSHRRENGVRRSRTRSRSRSRSPPREQGYGSEGDDGKPRARHRSSGSHYRNDYYDNRPRRGSGQRDLRNCNR